MSVDADYQVDPTVLPGEPTKQPPWVRFQADRYQFAVPVMAEVYVTRLLNREEFHQHCDRYRTRQAILANLQ